MIEYDELKIYRGCDIPITKKITIIQPTLGDIEEFGEKKYFGAIHTLTSVGADLKWQLFDMGIDYTTINDYDLFIKLISQLVSSKKNNLVKFSPEELTKVSNDEIEEMKINPLQLILKDIDLADFILCRNTKNNEIILYDSKSDITIDKFVYFNLVNIVRKIHGLKRNSQIPANEATKIDLIEDARDEFLLASKTPYKSVLQPLVSGMINQSGFKFNHNDVWDMKVNAFFDSVKRIGKIQDAQLLLQGAYSGFGSLKGIDKERLNWAAELV